ncbi:MAG: FkbM family methyltransferase, partial [Deltaproteobacteria bacterium]|nr:FkbM family methyltransferase [Deltaproteobacteria bacterium]
MRSFEKYCLALRHSGHLERADWLWGKVRPLYDALVVCTGKKGLQRVINGTDPILIAPQLRNITERYEPETWHSLMREIRPGDTFVDVGVFIGLYTIAVAKRVGAAGRVVSFEPDHFNYLAAKNNVELNGLEDRVDLLPIAVGDIDGTVHFKNGGDMAHVAADANEGTST